MAVGSNVLDEDGVSHDEAADGKSFDKAVL